MGDDPTHNNSNGKSLGSKASRPKPLKRRTTAGDSPQTPRAFTASADNKVKENEKEKEMAASFLQFCAMCEKQIMTPSNSILYCSEACRRKDSAKPLSASTLPSSPRPSPVPSSPRPTLPTRLSSTSTEYQNTLPCRRTPTDLHDHQSDLDPTEWKPNISHRASATTSEAFRYLSRFHQAQAANNNDHPINLDRPSTAMRHKSTLSMTSLNTTPTPSLGNTPTTSASSFNSMYEFNLRPLPARTNPMYSTSAGKDRGIDLVTPHIPPPLVVGDAVCSVDDEAGGNFWRKKKVVSGSVPGEKGLGALFGKDA